MTDTYPAVPADHVRLDWLTPAGELREVDFTLEEAARLQRGEPVFRRGDDHVRTYTSAQLREGKARLLAERDQLDAWLADHPNP